MAYRRGAQRAIRDVARHNTSARNNAYSFLRYSIIGTLKTGWDLGIYASGTVTILVLVAEMWKVSYHSIPEFARYTEL